MKRKAYEMVAGKRSNLSLKESTLPDPSAGEVTIAIKAIGLNFADVFAIWGLYKATPKGVFVPGLEYAGEVVSVGEGLDRLKPGDKVMGVTRFGAYATHLNIDVKYVVPLPKNWSMEEGASFLVQGLTAYYALKDLGSIEKGQTVLIHSAAGGVGIWANRIAKQYDCFTIGTVGREEKIPFCKKEGYDEVFVRSKHFKEDLRNILGKRELNLVMECIGGKIMKDSFELMSPMGRMVVYGSAHYASPSNKPNILRILYKYLTRPKIDPQNMTNLNKSVLAFNLIWLYEKAEIMHRIIEELFSLPLGRPVVGNEFDFEELPEAIALFQTGKTKGKVVVKVK